MKKIEVIKELCIMCGYCINSPENETQKIFDWDDDGKSIVVNQIIDESRTTCPTGAIVITETDEESNP